MDLLWDYPHFGDKNFQYNPGMQEYVKRSSETLENLKLGAKTLMMFILFVKQIQQDSLMIEGALIQNVGMYRIRPCFCNEDHLIVAGLDEHPFITTGGITIYTHT